MSMTKIKELFGVPTQKQNVDWKNIVEEQQCPFSHKRCIKTRKSEHDIAIGTCTVAYGKSDTDIVICPFRLLENNQIFIDCLHLLTGHIPGNELHIVPEVAIPGGNVDYFLVSTDANRHVVDFVGIELQTMDTTGSVWSERQLLFKELGLIDTNTTIEDKSYGMNWKMTAKTILVQLHHKIKTFEALNKHLVLVAQDCLFDYMRREFTFSHISTNATLNDSMHFHSYTVKNQKGTLKLRLLKRYSTDSNGIAKLLGLNTCPKVDLNAIVKMLEGKITDDTRLIFG